MRIEASKILDDCILGDFMRQITLDEPVTEEFIGYLAQYGQLEYFPEFSRPFFRLSVSGKFILKGILGRRSVRLILVRSNKVAAYTEFKQLIDEYPDEVKELKA